MRRHEIKGELQIDEAEILAAAAPERGAEPVQHLGAARLRRLDHQRQLLAGLELGGRVDDQRMARQRFVESGKDLQRLGGVALPREKTAVALHHSQRRRIELVGALVAFARFLPLVGKVEDQRRMQILEDGVPVGAGELVDGIGRELRLARARHGPGRQQRGGKVGDGPADRQGELAASERILLVLDRAHPEHEPRDAVGLVDLQHAFGQPDRLVHLAVGEHGEEGAPEQFAVAGIAAQRRAIIGSGGGGITLAAGVAGGQIAAGGGRAREARRRLRPRGEQSRESDGKHGQCGHGRTPEAWRRDHGLSTPSGGRTPTVRPR